MKILYLIMMYISVYPIAMRLVHCCENRPVLSSWIASVRTTNVYEETSLGIFREKNDDETLGDFANDAYSMDNRRIAIWGRYLGRHVRHQLSYGEYCGLPSGIK